MTRLGTSGTSFTAGSGQLLTYCGFSEFRLLDRFLRGEDIEPILQDRLEVLSEVQEQAAQTGDGAWILPVLDVFGMMHNICRLYPQDYATYYTSTRALIDHVAVRGFYVHFKMFCDAQHIMPHRQAQADHAQQLYAVWHGCETVLPSKGNESGDHYNGNKNGWKPEDIPNPPSEFCWSQGSALSDQEPYVPCGDFSCFHGRRDNKAHSQQAGVKARISSCDLAFYVSGNTDSGNTNDPFPGTHQPTIHDEPIGAADQDVAGRRSAAPDVFHGLGMDAAKFGAGGTFHSDCGLQSVPFTDIQRACAKAFVMGLSKVDPVQRYQG